MANHLSLRSTFQAVTFFSAIVCAVGLVASHVCFAQLEEISALHTAWGFDAAALACATAYSLSRFGARKTFIALCIASCLFAAATHACHGFGVDSGKIFDTPWILAGAWGADGLAALSFCVAAYLSYRPKHSDGRLNIYMPENWKNGPKETTAMQFYGSMSADPESLSIGFKKHHIIVDHVYEPYALLDEVIGALPNCRTFSFEHIPQSATEGGRNSFADQFMAALVNHFSSLDVYTGKVTHKSEVSQLTVIANIDKGRNLKLTVENGQIIRTIVDKSKR